MSVSITYPVGSDHDEVGKGGTAWLLAGTLEAMAAEALGPTYQVSSAVDRGRVRFTLLSTPEAWESGLGTLSTVLSRRDLSGPAFEAVRTRLLNRMTFEAGAPVREFEAETARLYGAGEADWARPPDGETESLQGVTLNDLQQYRRGNLRAGTAVAAVVGPVEPEEAAASVAASLGSGPDEPRAATREAWATGDRIVISRDITNTALAYAYPLPPEHSRTDADFLAHVLVEKLVSDPPDPGVYGVVARVVDAPAGPLLVIEATVFPDRGDEWARRISAAVGEVRLTNPEEDVFFPWQHRRFRSVVLESEATPEALGVRMTEDLLRAGEVRDLDVESRELGARDLVLLANDLGAPRILLFGPDLSGQQDP